MDISLFNVVDGKIVGVNLMSLGACLTPLIIFAVQQVKKYVPALDKKAWLPIAFGICGFVSTGLSSGVVNSWESFASYAVSGALSGGIASSVRDIWVGK